jgi:hypothetical protein
MVIRSAQSLDDVLLVSGGDIDLTAYVAGARARRPI